MYILAAERTQTAFEPGGAALLCDLAFSPDGKRLAGASRDLIKMWDAETGVEVLTLRGAPQRYRDPPFNARVIFHPDGTRLAGTNWNESISVWDARRTPTREPGFSGRRSAAEPRMNGRCSGICKRPSNVWITRTGMWRGFICNDCCDPEAEKRWTNGQCQRGGGWQNQLADASRSPCRGSISPRKRDSCIRVLRGESVPSTAPRRA